MQYSIIRPGDRVFRREDTLASKIVRLRTLSQWSHCGIVIGRQDNTVKCLSATFKHGVTVDNLREWGRKIQILRMENITGKQLDDMIDFCIRQVGKKYDYCGLFDFLFMQKLQSDSRWFCSELIYSAMLSIDVDIFKGRKCSGIVSPGDLYENPKLNFVCEI